MNGTECVLPLRHSDCKRNNSTNLDNYLILSVLSRNCGFKILTQLLFMQLVTSSQCQCG